MRRGRHGNSPKISEKQARSIIAKLRAGTSSVTAEARRLGVYHASVRKACRAVLGSKEYAKLADQIHHRKLTPRAKPASRERKLSPAANKPRQQSQSVTPGPIVLRPLFVEIVAGKTVELSLGETHVLLLQRLGESLRITSARRTPRTFTDALVLGGTVIVPHSRVGDVCEALREAAG